MADTEQDTIQELSVQRRAVPRDVPDSFVGVSWFWTRDEEDIADWWSAQRDRDLRAFWMRRGNDILAGAVSSMVKKFKAMNWVLEGGQRVVNRYQPVLAEAEFGQGWGTLLGKTVTDYLSQDQGAFWELIGRGDPDKPIEGQVLGVAHLDAGKCQLTGDPVYPVLFASTKDQKSHKLHATRVVHFVDMPSPNENMNGVGFCGVSRVIASSQVLLRLARYKNEKLSDLPQAGLLILNNIMPTQWEDAQANYQRERRTKGQEFWANVMTLIGLDPTQPVSAELLSFAALPDAFDELQSTNIYVNVVALAFGVDVREFWPLSAGPLGTAAETLIQHQKARGKGIGDLISTLERAVNWKVLPPSVSFKFDFRDDEEDRQKAEIADVRTKTIMSMWEPPTSVQAIEAGLLPPVSRVEIRQMLADNVSYFKDDFLVVDVTEETEATDIEREKALGPWVQVDRKGQVRVPPVARKEIPLDNVLRLAEQNYREGLVGAEDLAEFALGELLDRRLGDGDGD